MFAGDKKSVSSEVQHALRHLGLSHLLAVSGYHVSLVSLVFFLLMQRQQRLLRWGSVLGLPACLGLCGGHRLVSLGHQGCGHGDLGMVVLVRVADP